MFYHHGNDSSNELLEGYGVHIISKSGLFRVPTTDSVVKSKQDPTQADPSIITRERKDWIQTANVEHHALVKSALSKYEQKPWTSLHFQVSVLYHIEKHVSNVQKGGHHVDVYQYKT
uniref:Uncharacterized protein n=1 Tax=Mus spicilegus TaxID=10103 RepID=A0A8C6HBZ2_MUSSI